MSVTLRIRLLVKWEDVVLVIRRCHLIFVYNLRRQRYISEEDMTILRK